MRGLDFENLSESPALGLIFYLWPGDKRQQLCYLNVAIQNHNTIADSKGLVCHASEREWVTFIAIILS